jgi:hypothetical protein
MNAICFELSSSWQSDFETTRIKLQRIGHRQRLPPLFLRKLRGKVRENVGQVANAYRSKHMCVLTRPAVIQTCLSSSDTPILIRPEELRIGPPRSLGIEVPRSCTCTRTQRASRSLLFIPTPRSRSRRQLTSTYRLHVPRHSAIRTEIKEVGCPNRTLADNSGFPCICYAMLLCNWPRLSLPRGNRP